MEQALVNSLQALQADRAMQAHAFICILLDKESVDMSRVTADYQAHLSTIIMPRGYRPNASKNTKSIVTDMLRIFLSKNIDNLAKAAKNLGLHMPIGERLLKPSYLAVTLRPRGDYTTSERNWFSILVGIYQSYQIMNAAAHSGDYGMYPPALVHYNSCDLQLFLEDAHALFAYG
ncbi:hypothetical protein ABQZ69_22080 [Xanthomonas sp. WHRI 8391]|uniref:hypothetical protein n=1 Tax=unclassified Xanthomonas TaxID=2643310 RepID=UPI001A1CB09D|nr:hypothetical protein [Xanthomonas hortorum pv. carotae]